MDDQLNRYLEGMEARLTEGLHDMQTELLGGLGAFSAGQVLRVRTVEAGYFKLNDCAIRSASRF